MRTIRTPEDLHRANIAMAWSLVGRMRPEQFEALCEVTVAQIRRDAGGDDVAPRRGCA